MSLTRELPRYQCNKTVQALKIAHVLANPRGVELHFEDQRFVPLQVDAAWFDQHKVEAGGYLTISNVVIMGYLPGPIFENDYTLIEDAP